MATTILLIVIFISYIGLGIPDSLLGSAWPAMYVDLGIDVSNVSIISLIISLGTILSSFTSERIVKKFKTGPVAIMSTALTVISLFGYSISNNMLWLCLFSIPQGIGAGSIDVALNSYIAKHFDARQMSFLHCSYGVGVSLSPYLMSVFLKSNMNWQSGYRTMFLIQFGILLIMLVSLPLWKKVNADEYSDEQRQVVPFREIARDKGVRITWYAFIGSCSVEAGCLVWGGTFLVDARGLSAEYGARIITFYFVGLALGRFVSGLTVKRLGTRRLVYIGQGILLIAILLVIVSRSIAISTIGLFLIGFGNGPIFPNMTQMTPELFGDRKSQAIIGSQMGMCYISFMVSPLLFGWISKWLTIGFFPYYLMIFYAIMIVATVFLGKHTKIKEL